MGGDYTAVDIVLDIKETPSAALRLEPDVRKWREHRMVSVIRVPRGTQAGLTSVILAGQDKKSGRISHMEITLRALKIVVDRLVAADEATRSAPDRSPLH